MHGGLTQIDHGRYSLIARGNIAEMLALMEDESEREQLDILPEARMIRALAMDFVERYERIVNAFINWNEAELSEAKAERRKPRMIRIPDISEAATLMEKSASVVDKIHRQRAANAIDIKTFHRLMANMAKSVKGIIQETFGPVVPDNLVEKAFERIEKEWSEIKV